jgi:uncharacterized membrane protein YedE/YeeE
LVIEIPRREGRRLMGNDRRLAGTGSLVFTALLVAAAIAANAPGGKYHANDVADFVAKGHRSAVMISLFLVAAAIVGLLVVMAYLCETSFGTGRSGRIAWGTSLFAAGSFLVGCASRDWQASCRRCAKRSTSD